MAHTDQNKDDYLRAIDNDDSTAPSAATLSKLHVDDEILVEDETEDALEDTGEDMANLAQPYQDKWSKITAFAVILAAIGWTGFYIWSQYKGFRSDDIVRDIPALLANWAIPILLLVGLYWLVSRRRGAHALHYERQAMLVDDAGRQLESRLQKMNCELAIAHEFIDNQSRHLEALSRSAISDITQHAERISSLVGDSQTSMKTVAEVSLTAEQNMSKLREQMPVVIGTAKNMVNQIGAAELTAQRQIKGMVSGFQKINEFGKASDQHVIDLERRIKTAIHGLDDKMSSIKNSSEETAAFLLNHSDKAAAMLADGQNAAKSSFAQLAEALQSQLEVTSTHLTDQAAQFNDLMHRMNSNQEKQTAHANAAITDLEERINAIYDNLQNNESIAGEKTAQISFALSALRSELEHIGGSLTASDAMASQLREHGEVLRSDYSALACEIEDVAEEKMSKLKDALENNQTATQSALQNVNAMKKALKTVDELTSNNIIILAEQEQHIATYSDAFVEFSHRNREQSAIALNALQDVEKSIAIIEKAGDEKILAKFAEIGQSSDALLSKVEGDIDSIINNLSEKISERSSAALEQSVRAKSEEVIGKLQMAVNNALGATHTASASLTSQLGKVDELASNLEERIAYMQENSPLRNDQELSRNLALLTESLNSLSIDVAKLLSNDVTDTAWAAYLKGDRGVFTRRAVRLIGNNDARQITDHYENDAEFNQTVNRYIHDFEAILRDLLSTRNGEAISVTLLSSDMGKLYVALAQAIERFR